MIRPFCVVTFGHWACQSCPLNWSGLLYCPPFIHKLKIAIALQAFHNVNFAVKFLTRKWKLLRKYYGKQNPKRKSKIYLGLRLQRDLGKASQTLTHPCLVSFLVCVRSRILPDLVWPLNHSPRKWLSVLLLHTITWRFPPESLMPRSYFLFLILTQDIPVDFKKRGREEEREKEKHWCEKTHW